MQQKNKTIIVIVLILFLFPVYYLSDFTVYGNKYYIIIFFTSLVVTSMVLFLNKNYRLAIFEKFVLSKKQTRLGLQNKLFLFLQFLGYKIGFVLGFLFISFYLLYSMFNLSVYFYSLNSNLNSEIVKINKIEMYKNNMKYEFYFKKVIVSKRTSMNSINREILDGKKEINNYAIHVFYRKSLPDTYFITKKIFISKPNGVGM